MAKGRKTGGRQKGSRNKAGADVKAKCRALIETPDYETDFKRRLAAGQLPPVLEAMTWHYAYGKPTEHVQLSGEDGGPVAVRFIDVDA